LHHAGSGVDIMSITAKSDLDYNKRWDNSLEKLSVSDDETKLMDIPQLGLALHQERAS
jgi:hypothetical protein